MRRIAAHKFLLLGFRVLAHAQVWMITGDKQETAINIAVACRLVHHADALLVANEDRSAEAAEALLRDLIAQARRRNAAEVRTRDRVYSPYPMLPAHMCP